MSVDRKYAVEINGQGYILNRNRYQQTFAGGFVPALGGEGEDASVDSFWRRKRYSDWSSGYNQKETEATEALANRFLDSTGIDVSTPGEFKLLPTTTQTIASGATTQLLTAALGKLWLAIDANVFHTTDGTNWTGPVATGITGSIRAITNDGVDLYVYGTSGNIRKGSTGAYADANTSGVAPLNLQWHNNALYGSNGRYFSKIELASHTNVVDPGSGFTTRFVTEHNNKLAFITRRGSNSEAKSYVYESDGTTAGSKVLIDDLPDGFTANGLFSYSDVLWIYGGYYFSASTSNGGLFAYTQGQLTFAGNFAETAHVGDPNPRAVPTIDTGPVLAFGLGQFMYFGMLEGTGVWRYDLKHGGLSRCYSIQSGNAAVTGGATFLGAVHLAATGLGAYKQTTTFPASGFLTLSTTSMNHSNAKVGRRVIITARKNSGSATANYSPSVIPSAASPVWTKTTSGTPTESISNGLLTVDLDAAADDIKYSRGTLGLANATGWTIEVKMQTDDVTGATDFQGVDVRDDVRKVTLQILKNKVNFTGGAATSTIVMDTTDTEHTYRVTAKSDVMKLYIDKVLKATVTQTVANTDNTIDWAGISGGATAAAKATWRYVRYWDDAAIPPDRYAFATNPVLVEASDDSGQNFMMLSADEEFKNYSLSDIPEWDSLQVKITLSDSDMVINDVTIEAVPTLPIVRKWDMFIDLYSDMDLENGASERIDTQVLFESLEEARVNKSPITMKDIDFDIATNPTVRKALIEELTRGKVEVIDQDVENIIRLRLREV